MLLLKNMCSFMHYETPSNSLSYYANLSVYLRHIYFLCCRKSTPLEQGYPTNSRTSSQPNSSSDESPGMVTALAHLTFSFFEVILHISIFFQPIATNRVGEKAEPLLDCVFIQSNLPAARPVAPTTATKECRATMTNKPRKNPAREKNTTRIVTIAECS